MTNKEMMKMAKAMWKVIVMRDDLKNDTLTQKDIGAYELEISRFLHNDYGTFRAELEEKIEAWAMADGIAIKSY